MTGTPVLLFLDYSSLVFASPTLPEQQLSEPTTWNSGKAMKAERGPFPKKKEMGDTERLVPRGPTRPYSVSVLDRNILGRQ